MDEIISHEIRVVAVQGGKLGQQRNGEKAPVAEGQHESQHAGNEEIPVVHMRQEIGDTHGKQQGKAEEHRVVKLSALHGGDRIRRKHEGKRRRYEKR